MKTTADDMTCSMCGKELDSPVLVQMMWLIPDEARAITVGSQFYKVCTSCAEKVKNLLEGSNTDEEEKETDKD